MTTPPRMRFALLFVLLPIAASFAQDKTQPQTREEMQRALNERLMSTPFNPGDAAKAQAFAEQSKRQDVVPVAQAPAFWVPGWTCASYTLSPYYNYLTYQNCVYYHYYYGRFW